MGGQRPWEDPIEYDRVADVYDRYVKQDFDVPFLVEEATKAGGKVLELMCGTGRVSLPLVEAGVDLTCVDASGGMLARLEEKLRERSLAARVVRADVRRLDLPREYDLAMVPFHSFSELVTRRDQELALEAIRGCLKKGGRLICPLQNPALRARQADGTLRLGGTFPVEDGTVVVSGFETLDGRTGIVDRTQFYESFDASGNLRAKRLLPMRFALISREQFAELVETTGFELEALHGDYDHSEYREETSPHMVWVLRAKISV